MKNHRLLRTTLAAFLAASMLTPVLSASASVSYTSNTVEVEHVQATPTPAPTPTPEPPQSSAVSVQKLYLASDAHTVAVGGRVTAELVLKVDNADGALEPFGVELDLSDAADVELLSPAYAGDDIRYSDGVLWVERGQARGGEVHVANAEVELRFSFVPFSEGSTAERAVIGIDLLDANGHAQGLQPVDDGDVYIRNRLTLQREPEPVEEPTAEPTGEPAEEPAEIEVTIHFVDERDSYFFGEALTLASEIHAPEDDAREYTYQWQYKPTPDSDEWFDIPGANSPTYTFILDEASVSYSWRVSVQ